MRMCEPTIRNVAADQDWRPTNLAKSPVCSSLTTSLVFQAIMIITVSTLSSSPIDNWLRYYISMSTRGELDEAKGLIDEGVDMESTEWVWVLLLDNGANVSNKDDYNDTVLHRAGVKMKQWISYSKEGPIFMLRITTSTLYSTLPNTTINSKILYCCHHQIEAAMKASKNSEFYHSINTDTWMKRKERSIMTAVHYPL